jgi:archaellum component FlaC
VFDADFLLAFAFMALLFLRQISILKEPNKINYAPLMLGIGAISAVVHFIIHPESMDMFMALKESFIPILVSLILYIIMNILHQTQQAEQAKMQHKFSQVLTKQLEELAEFSSQFDRKMILNQNQDKQLQEESRERFKHDIKALDSLLINQNKFLEKFQELHGLHESVKNSFENFTEVELPSLDKIVHKHIDILRVAEQDHFNKVKTILTRAVESRDEIVDEIEELKESLHAMSTISKTIANTITQETLGQLSSVTKPFEKELLSIKSHAQGVETSLYESENRLGGIKEQSEMIMKQMILSSNKMSELRTQNASLHDIYATMRDLIKDIEGVKSEYVKSQSQLSIIIKEFKEIKESEAKSTKEQIESLGNTLNDKIDSSLEKLHKDYHVAKEDISQSVKFLSKQAQLKNRYYDSES